MGTWPPTRKAYQVEVGSGATLNGLNLGHRCELMDLADAVTVKQAGFKESCVMTGSRAALPRHNCRASHVGKMVNELQLMLQLCGNDNDLHEPNTKIPEKAVGRNYYMHLIDGCVHSGGEP